VPPDPRLVALYAEIAQAHSAAVAGSEQAAYAANALAAGLDGDNADAAKRRLRDGNRAAREGIHRAGQAYERLVMMLRGA